jgi:hypothetical protein
MSSRNFLKHTITPTFPAGSSAGDEVYDPVQNRLYKELLVNGTTTTQTEVLLNGPGLASSNLSIGTVSLQSSNTSYTTSNNTLNVTGGVGVANSVYVGNRIGFGNTSTSIAYQVYNPALQTIDTIFG